jgi:hypothetical protein
MRQKQRSVVIKGYLKQRTVCGVYHGGDDAIGNTPARHGSPFDFWHEPQLAVALGFPPTPDGETIPGIVPVVAGHAEEGNFAGLLVMAKMGKVQVRRHVAPALAAAGAVRRDQRRPILAPRPTVIRA